MPDLEVWRWEKYIPDLGKNRELKQPFYFRIKSGLPKLAMKDFFRRIDALKEKPEELWERLAPAFEGMVEFGDEPLTLGGKPVTKLTEYFQVVAEYTNSAPYVELVEAVTQLNTLGGTRALFYERLSGGGASTAYPPTERAAK